VTYGHRIAVSRGSIPHYGRVIVRGVEIDVDAVLADGERAPVEEDAFLRWVQMAQARA